MDYKDDLEKKPSHMEMVTVQATAGMVAGACSSVITTPIDTIKTRLQVLLSYGLHWLRENFTVFIILFKSLYVLRRPFTHVKH